MIVVVAPYATALAAMFEFRTPCATFAGLQQAGGLGAYGFYESLDYTRTRVPEGQDHADRSRLLCAPSRHVDRGVRERHHGRRNAGSLPCRADREATELLLQERPPREDPRGRSQTRRMWPRRRTFASSHRR